MFKDITLGQYYPMDSFIHKLDPRIKIITMVLFMTFLFTVQGIVGYTAGIIMIVTVSLASKLKLSMLYRGVKPLKWILLITFIINIFFTPGEPIFSLGPASITLEGVITGVKLALRLVMLVMSTSILTLSTSPLELTDGIEGVLSPLKYIKVPVHEIAMMMTIALRFIPTLIDETDKILKAQMARGADFESGNIIKRAKNMVPLLVPLLLSSITRADELSVAMEARCYRGSVGRTKLHPLKIQVKDILFLIGVVGLLIGVFYIDRSIDINFINIFKGRY